MRVLGIETSCDETAAALFDSEQGLLAHNLYSQVALHRQYGGVVPELASRDHVRKLLPLIERTLQQGASGAVDIDGIAYTAGPGLVGALLVGASVGQSLARVWEIPALAIHHMEGHLLAPLMEPDPPVFPFIALLVSGGHTQLMQVAGLGDYRLLGESVDDAAGEAFDKTAKLLGLDYPGGPALARLAERGDARRFRFPRPMTNRPGLDFSFSGLKTFAANTLRDCGADPQTRADIATAFQEAVADTLVIKCRRAVTETGLKRLVIAGGVGANIRLRQRLARYAADDGVALHYPRPEFCTDNGAMIAYAGCQRLLHGEAGVRDITTRARWDLGGLRPPGVA